MSIVSFSALHRHGPLDRAVGFTPIRARVRRCELRVRGRVCELTHREFLLLQCLMGKEGGACSRAELLSEVWGYDFDPGTNVVDVGIRRLRCKLGPDVVATIRNVGYALEAA